MSSADESWIAFNNTLQLSSFSALSMASIIRATWLHTLATLGYTTVNPISDTKACARNACRQSITFWKKKTKEKTRKKILLFKKEKLSLNTWIMTILCIIFFSSNLRFQNRNYQFMNDENQWHTQTLKHFEKPGLEPHDKVMPELALHTQIIIRTLSRTSLAKAFAELFTDGD